MDDEVAVRMVTTQMLNRMGFDALAVTSGADVLTILQERTCALVLVDLSMPGMSGAAVLAAVRQEAPGVPVVMMTGYGPEEVARAIPEGGYAGVLTKPFSKQSLRQVIEQLLEE